MSERKSKFYWASVAGADPEPVEVTKVDGKRVAFTIGCPVPFPLGRGSHVRLGRETTEWGGSRQFFTTIDPEPMTRPVHATKEQVQREKDRIAYENRPLPQHSWRGPR